MPDFIFTKADLYRSLPDRFRSIVQGVPAGHLAATGDDQDLSYTRLDELSDQLASRLLDLAGSSPQPIGLLLPPTSFDAIIASVGVVKAGHFFLPLDLALPDAGLQDIFRNCPIRVIISHAGLRQQAEKMLTKGQQLLFVEELPAGPLERKWPEIPLNAYAALYYTSGSTGKPRGVLRTHQQVMRGSYLLSQNMRFPAAEQVGTTYISSHSSANTPMWCALLNGSSLHRLSVQETSPQAIYEWLQAKKISYLLSSPGVLRCLVGLAADHPPISSLHTILSAMEPIKRHEVDALFHLIAPGGQFVNTLSSTELHFITRLQLQADSAWQGDILPAGRVLEFAEVLIVDENGQPLPSGQIGEIWVRNHFKIGGYWNNEELMAARLAPSPIDRGEPFFKTGDFGLMDGDGVLQFKGRMDFMVKVRGYRIQLEEIEDALNALDGVKEAVVIAQEISSGEKRLVAYCAAVNPGEISAGKLRQMLAQKLPSYKIPALFILLDQPIPRTASGKPDRKALPPSCHARPDLDVPYCAPREELEQGIANVWARLLELDRAGVNDNFFELGGDSLSALSMLLQVEEVFKTRISADYFKEPTIAHLATRIAAASPACAPELNLPAPAPGLQPLRKWGQPEMLETGPLFEKFSLPYGIGVQLQRTWLSSGKLRASQFQSWLHLIREWAVRVGEPNLEDALQSSLLANTWWVWRGHRLGKRLENSRWLTVSGDRALWQPRSKGTGAIFMVMHSRLTHIFMRGLSAAGRSPFFIQGVSLDPIADQMGLAAQMYKAHQVLEKGEPVLLAGDGFRGKQGVTVPFWGQTRKVRQGGAELAVRTGAELVPVFCSIRPNGHVDIEVCPGLARGNGPAEEQIETLTRAYAELFTARWPQVYASERWEHLQGWEQKISQGQI